MRMKTQSMQGAAVSGAGGFAAAAHDGGRAGGLDHHRDGCVEAGILRGAGRERQLQPAQDAVSLRQDHGQRRLLSGAQERLAVVVRRVHGF